MPKMKTHRGTAKRVKKTGGGKFKRHRAFANHKFTKKSAKRKRRLRQATLVPASERKRMRILLPYS